MKKDLREIYLAPNRASAEVAINVFAEKYGAKYDKAVECLTKDREALLALYEFPAEHWDHLRTTDEIDKHFLSGRAIIVPAWATSRRNAAHRLKASPGDCRIEAPARLFL